MRIPRRIFSLKAVHSMPEASFDQIANTLRVLTKLVPPSDPEMQPSTGDIGAVFIP